jgi:putative copper resistance protein D
VLEFGLIVARWLHYAAVTALFGLALIRLYAPKAAAGARLGVMAALLALISGAAWFALTAAGMGGVGLVLTGTDFGPIWAGRLALAALLCLPPLQRAPRLHAGLCGLLLASLALTGHARMHDGALGWAHAANDAAHLLAAGTWLGALTAFVLRLRRAKDDPATVQALADFGRVGVASVGVLLASGLVNAWLILGGLAPLFSGLYGRLLLVKVALFAMMVGLAADNRLRLVPQSQAGSAEALARLRAHVIAEQALGLAVLAAVAVLGTLDPAV